MLSEIWRHRDFVFVNGNIDLFKSYFRNYFSDVSKISLLYVTGSDILSFVAVQR